MPSHSPLYDVTAQVLAPVAPFIPQTLLRWETSKTPLSDLPSVVAAITTYLVTIFSLRAYLRSRKAQRTGSQKSSNSSKNGSTVSAAASLMDGKPAREPPLIASSYLKLPFLVHNIALAFGSFWLLALMLEEILPITQRNGPFYSICSPGAWTMRMETYYIINYYLCVAAGTGKLEPGLREGCNKRRERTC